MPEEKNLGDELSQFKGKLKKQVDRDLEPMGDDEKMNLKLGWVVHEYGPNDALPVPPGNHQGTEYSAPLIGSNGDLRIPIDEATRRRGRTSIEVLPFLVGKPWNNLAINGIRSLRTDEIRVTKGGVNLDSRAWRVTVHLNQDDTIRKIEQEVEVGLIGCYHGHHLDIVTKDPNYQGEPPRAFFNPEAVSKLTMDS